MSAERQRLVGRDEQQGESDVYLLLLDVDQAQRIAVERLAELRSHSGPHTAPMTDEELALQLTIEEATMAEERIQEGIMLHDIAHLSDEDDLRHEPQLRLLAPTPVSAAPREELTILNAASEAPSQGYHEAPVWLLEPPAQSPMASPPSSPTKPPTPFVRRPSAYVRPPTPYEDTPSDEERSSPSSMYVSPRLPSVPTTEMPRGYYEVPPRPTRSYAYTEAHSESLTPLDFSAGPNNGR